MPIKIASVAGIEIKKEQNFILFGKNISKPSFQEKRYKDYRNYFQDQSLDINQSLYYIYRGVSLFKDEHIFKQTEIRYDITMLFPGNVGNEPIHTIGHFHTKANDGITYPEIYQVISGKALFLLQNSKHKEFYISELNQGQKIIIPPDFGHITINKSSGNELVIANLFTSKKNTSDYNILESHHGPIWYPNRGKDEIIFVKNNSYSSHPKIKKISPKNISHFDIKNNEPLYKEFINKPQSFDFINCPKKFLKNFSI